MDNVDFILNGQGHGSVAATLLQNGFQTGALRPFIGKDGRNYITINQNGIDIAIPTNNAPATLRKDEWEKLDRAVLKAARPRLRAVGDLRAAGLTYAIPEGMGKTVLQYQTQTDITPAIISMDGIRQGQRDRPVYDLLNLPLPIIHKDFSFTAREIAVSRNPGGTPLDTEMAELASYKVAETADKLLMGVLSTYTYGGGTIYGYTNYPGRMTQVMTNPTAAGWTPNDTVSEVLAMVSQSMAHQHYGPWMLYTSPLWQAFLENDYSAAKGDLTLRERIAKTKGIDMAETSDFLTGYRMVLVEKKSTVAREVIAMDMTTLQWETNGGMEVCFKVMCIMVPQLRADSDGNTGIVDGAAP